MMMVIEYDDDDGDDDAVDDEHNDAIDDAVGGAEGRSAVGRQHAEGTRGLDPAGAPKAQRSPTAAGAS